ncbi:hypothetical protein RBK64_26935, partial [Pseudomonas aeruginosa]|nr:hypothetical protein [Pseudomonas aeruginosa]
MKNSLSSKLVFPRGGADGELGDSARITLPRIDLVADGERGVAARTTSPGPDLGAGGELGGSTGTTSPGTDFGAGGEWVVRAETLHQEPTSAPTVSW